MSMEIEYISVRTAENGWIVSVDLVDKTEYEHGSEGNFVFLHWDEVIRFMIDPLDAIEASKAIKNGEPHEVIGDK
jgi:hypothetical protein